MSRTSRSKYAILGLLAEGDKSGYDIKKTIEREIDAFWHESYGQIYPTLRALEDASMVAKSAQAEAEQTSRQLYAITEAGRAELIHWLKQPVAYQPERIEILLKLFFAQNLPISASIAHVEAYRAEMLRRRTLLQNSLTTVQAGYYPSPSKAQYASITCSYGIHSLTALINWCDETLEHLRTLEE